MPSSGLIADYGPFLRNPLYRTISYQSEVVNNEHYVTESVQNELLFKFLADISPFCGATDINVFDFS